jgi:phosphoglucosamine mutase
MKLFGTDGIRGEAGRPPLDPVTLPLVGQAIGERIRGRILLARDPRESGPSIRDLLERGLREGGASIDDAGVLPTPAVALLVRETGLMGGIVISASHNPYHDNGIKVFRSDGRKLDDSTERAIELRVAQLEGNAAVPASSGPAERGAGAGEDWAAKYLDLIGARMPAGRWLDGLRITVDCANGAMSGVAPAYLETLGATLTTIHAVPDGRNINAGCGAVHPESMIRTVVESGSDFGVAFDGDGDRSMFATSSGVLVDGDAVLLLLARRMKADGVLEPPVVVGTSMTNYNLERKLSEEGIALVRTPVGDRYIFQEMLRSGAQLGGEPSGHVIFSDFRLSGDGLFTVLKVAESVVRTGNSLDSLTADWVPAPQILRNLRIPERIPLDDLPEVQEKIREVEQILTGRGRLVIRYSGTEPLLRVMVESDSESLSRASADRLVAFIGHVLGVSG